jgi:membrane protease YdiL (CAAX protease family)
MDLSNFTADFENLAFLCAPAAVYAVVLRWRHDVRRSEIVRRLGLTRGNGRWHAIALGAAVPAAAVGALISSWSSGFEGSVLAPFVGATPSAAMILRALSYGVIATGYPEELLFRGLIGGALFRRMSFAKANGLQAAIFLLPHLLILLVAPRLWFLAIPIPLVLGLLNGWLRQRSDSVWPGVLVHATSNVAGALAVLQWAGR